MATTLTPKERRAHSISIAESILPSVSLVAKESIALQLFIISAEIDELFSTGFLQGQKVKMKFIGAIAKKTTELANAATVGTRELETMNVELSILQKDQGFRIFLQSNDREDEANG
jgi:hypothetical protein